MQIEYKIERNKPIIYVFKYVDEKRTYTKIKDFRPYFYVLEDEVVQIESPHIFQVIEGDFVSSKGEKLKKIICFSPMDIIFARKLFSKSFEADVLYPTRYTIDKIKKIPYEKLRIHYMDIENNDSLDTINAPEPITSITIWDNFLQKYIIFAWRKDQNKREFKHENKSIYYFNSEKDMLKTYMSFVIDTNPDILTGWNISRFDMPYIINRMNKLGIDYRNLSPIREVINKDEITIKGRIIFEMLKGYEYVLENAPDSRRLDDVGRNELGLEKLKFEGTPGQLWKKNLSKLIEYNIRDVEILKELDKKKNIIHFVDELRRMTNCSFNDSMFMSFMFDSFLLTQFHNKVIFETRSKGNVHNKFKGAEIITPIKGLHHNVLHIDLKSLYPSIIISFNMSPETLDKSGDINVGNGVKFNSKQESILVKLEKILWNLRDKKKEELSKEKDKNKIKILDNEQYCIKLVMNAIYGQTSFPKARIFCPQIASSITYVGRKILLATVEKLKELGHEVIYGDTDGLFIKIQKETNPIELVKEINKYYTEFCKQFGVKDNVFDIEYEKFYKSFIINSKKRYAGILTFKKGKDVNEFDVKGMEVRRSDNSRFTRDLQKEVLTMVLNAEDKEKIKNYIRNEIKKFKGKKYKYEEMAIPRGLTNEPHKYTSTSPWIRGCIYSQNYLNLKFNKGDKVKLLYIKQMPPRLPPTPELCFFNNHEVPRGVEIDFDKMIEKGVIMKLDTILETVGWDILDIIGENKSLLEF